MATSTTKSASPIPRQRNVDSDLAEGIDQNLVTLHAALLELADDLPGGLVQHPALAVIERQVAILHRTTAHMRRAAMFPETGGAS